MESQSNIKAMQGYSSKPTTRPSHPPPAHDDLGSESESDYSSSDVTEDEDGEELTPALDAAILRTLSKIKKKEGVYGVENVLQEELKKAQERAEAKGIKANVAKKAAEKPYLLADYHRAKLLSGETQEDEEYESTEPMTYVQSERVLRQEAVSAFKALADESEDEGDFVTKRVKDEEEVKQDDEEYRQFMLEMGGGEDEVKKVLGLGDQPVNNYLADSEEEEEPKNSVISKVEKEEMITKKKAKKEKKAKDDDEFLMNYILNRGWIDRADDHVPTYKEIVGPDHEVEEETKSTLAPAESSSHPWGRLDEDDDFEDKAEQFETEYNFRFEEPGSSSIVSHPRLIPSLVRRPDDARKSKRARKAERKAAERAAQEDDIRAQKGSKRREMEKRMASLKADLAEEGVEGGVDWSQLEKVLDGEWNEAEWEKVVGGMLSRANADEEDADGKPIWDDDLGDAEYDETDKEGGEQNGEEDMQVEGAWDEQADDGPINMDADFMEEEHSKKKRKKNKKDKKDKKGAAEPDVEDAAETDLTVADKAQAVKEAMEEYRALDHEDMIGDLPTRFKYTQTASAAYGLTPVEILLATDDELNNILSVKTIAPYRKGGVGIQGKGLGKRVRELKDDLKRRRWGQEDKPWKETKDHEIRQRHGEASGGGQRAGKRKGRKERQRAQKVEQPDAATAA